MKTHRISIRKRLLVVIGILTSLFIFNACNTTKRLDRVIKKYGAKETLVHITEEYPELFNNKVEDIVIFDTDTVYVPAKDGVIVSTIVHDTVFFKDKNVEIAVNKNTGKGHYKLPKDTVITHDTIRVPVVTKCPDVAIQNDKIRTLQEKLEDRKHNYNTAIIILSGIILLLVGFILYITKR